MVYTTPHRHHSYQLYQFYHCDEYKHQHPTRVGERGKWIQQSTPLDMLQYRHRWSTCCAAQYHKSIKSEPRTRLKWLMLWLGSFYVLLSIQTQHKVSRWVNSLREVHTVWPDPLQECLDLEQPRQLQLAPGTCPRGNSSMLFLFVVEVYHREVPVITYNVFII